MASLVSSLELASDKDDDGVISVGARLIVSMPELGHRISPHFATRWLLVPGLWVLSGVDPARLGVIADILLAVLCPAPGCRQSRFEAGLDVDQQGTWCWRNDGGGACGKRQQAVLALLQRLAIGQKDERRWYGGDDARPLQFTVMRPRGGLARRPFGDTTLSLTSGRRPTTPGGSAEGGAADGNELTARERRIAFAERGRNAYALRVGTADLAAVRAVGRLLQGGSDEWGLCSWIAQQFASLAPGEAVRPSTQALRRGHHSLNKRHWTQAMRALLFCEFEDRG